MTSFTLYLLFFWDLPEAGNPDETRTGYLLLQVYCYCSVLHGHRKVIAEAVCRTGYLGSASIVLENIKHATD
jgi:hypothetical protein